MKIKIHYAALNIQGDIPCIEFDDGDSVIDYLYHHVVNNPYKCVFLIAFDEDVFVTENEALVTDLFENCLPAAYPYYEGHDIFIQEYSSFEAAYDVALMMKETSRLCYEPDPIDN